MKKLYFLTLILLTGLTAQAQQDSNTDLSTTKRHVGMIEIGYLYGSATSFEAKTYKATPTVQIFNGYRFGNLLSVGGTAGFDFYDNILVTPVSLGLRGQLLNTGLSPIYSFDAGYGFTQLSDENPEKDADGGLMFSSALGLKANTGNTTAFTFTVGLKSQRVVTQSTSWNRTVDQKINYKRLTLRMGFMF